MNKIDELMHPHNLPKYSGSAIAVKKELQEGTYLNASDVYDAFEHLRPEIKSEVEKKYIELGKLVADNGVYFDDLRCVIDCLCSTGGEIEELIEQIKRQEAGWKS
jgi:hypothetical protein